MKALVIINLMLSVTISSAAVIVNHTIAELINKQKRFVVFNSRRLTDECLPICYESSSATLGPTDGPTAFALTDGPTTGPTTGPTDSPTDDPTSLPTDAPTTGPTGGPTAAPTGGPTSGPTAGPTGGPTGGPTAGPTDSPTENPTDSPTGGPTGEPTAGPTDSPTENPTDSPTVSPTLGPTSGPTVTHSEAPTRTHSVHPTTTFSPTAGPTESPTSRPTSGPTDEPSTTPTYGPTSGPTAGPTSDPTAGPTNEPTTSPTDSPTDGPTSFPTSGPTNEPTTTPTDGPSSGPTAGPTSDPTTSPTSEPTTSPSESPTDVPTSSPTECYNAPHSPYTSFPKELPDCKFEIRKKEQFNKYGMEAGKSGLANLYEDHWNVEYRTSDGNYKREVHLPDNVRSDSLFWANIKSTYDVEVYANNGATTVGYNKLLKKEQDYMMMNYKSHGFGWIDEEKYNICKGYTPDFSRFPNGIPDCKLLVSKEKEFEKFSTAENLKKAFKYEWNVVIQSKKDHFARNVYLPDNVRTGTFFKINNMYKGEGSHRVSIHFPNGDEKEFLAGTNEMWMYYRGFGWVDEKKWGDENLPKWPRQASEYAHVVDTQDEIDKIKNEQGTSGLVDLYNEYSEIKIYNENNQWGENYYLPDNVPDQSLFWIEVMSYLDVTVHWKGATSKTSGLSNQSRKLSYPKTDWILVYDKTYGWLTQSKWRDINDNYNE